MGMQTLRTTEGQKGKHRHECGVQNVNKRPQAGVSTLLAISNGREQGR